MNRLTIIGNLARDPESRTTSSGVNLCTFTVAVNRRRSSQSAADGQPEADFFRVTAWRQLGEVCQKYLSKGRKVAVVGPVTLNTFTGKDGATHATMEVSADDVEFLSSRSDAPAQTPSPESGTAPAGEKKEPSKYVEVEDEDLPF